MSQYQVQITKRAQKDYQKLSLAVQKRISRAILNLQISHSPRQSKYLTHYRLAQFRLRLGNYRVLYDIYHQDKTILILRLGHRKNIYR